MGVLGDGMASWVGKVRACQRARISEENFEEVEGGRGGVSFLSCACGGKCQAVHAANVAADSKSVMHSRPVVARRHL